MGTMNIREQLPLYGLKITPQRVAVFDAISKLRNHPTAENIIDYIRINHPNIAIGTVYNTLETFVEKGLISKVKTDEGVMRYDAAAEKHHHLYSRDSDLIGDYYDEELNHMLEDYFRNKTIPGFSVNDVRVQIVGKFTEKPSIGMM
jgi:Fur family peroxide stress response transcriptional regulator